MGVGVGVVLRGCGCGCSERSEQACGQQVASGTRIKGRARPSRVLSVTSVLCTPQGSAQTGDLWPQIMSISFLYTIERLDISRGQVTEKHI